MDKKYLNPEEKTSHNNTAQKNEQSINFSKNQTSSYSKSN